MYRICIHCYWRDRNNYQCFDGHIQYKNRQKCSGYCERLDFTGEDAFMSAEDTFMSEQAKIAYEEYMRSKYETNRIKRVCQS